MSNYFFEVLRSGISTTFQDRGRFHMQHLGVTPGGCMDLKLFSVANSLVGNFLDEGVLEFAYQGPLMKLIKGKTKVELPKTTKAEKLTLEEVKDILEKKAPKKKTRTKKAPAKKK